MKLPAHLRRSLSWDRGLEMTRPRRLQRRDWCAGLLLSPTKSLQRGTNENTNRLLRQYFPKGRPIDGYSQVRLDAVARQPNERPRQTLKFKTSAERLDSALTC